MTRSPHGYHLLRKGILLVILFLPLGACSKSEKVGKDTSASTRKGCNLEKEGPSMVEIPTSDGGSYCIDSTEVTQRQYSRFLASQPEKNDAYWPSNCAVTFAFADFTPNHDADKGCGPNTYNTKAPTDAPVRCVDWCDAHAYCLWAGKRLCGRIGGGYTFTSEDANNPDTNMWYRACRQGGTTEYALGSVDDLDQCSTSEEQIQKGANPTCHGTVSPYDQIFDLEGKVVEWEDADPIDPTKAEAIVHNSTGSGVVSSQKNNCAFEGSYLFSMVGPGVGFRCCVD